MPRRVLDSADGVGEKESKRPESTQRAIHTTEACAWHYTDDEQERVVLLTVSPLNILSTRVGYRQWTAKTRTSVGGVGSTACTTNLAATAMRWADVLLLFHRIVTIIPVQVFFWVRFLLDNSNSKWTFWCVVGGGTGGLIKSSATTVSVRINLIILVIKCGVN